MEKFGVIYRVDVPTEWCAGRDGHRPQGKQQGTYVCICVDLTKLKDADALYSLCKASHVTW